MLILEQIGKSLKRLMVQQNITAFFSNRGINVFMAHQSIFSTSSLKGPEFNAFDGVKHLCHTSKYLERPAIMVFPSNKELESSFLKIDNGNGDILNDFIFYLKRIPNAIAVL